MARIRPVQEIETKKRRPRIHSEMRLAGIVQSAMDAIITINQDQEVVLFNPAAERMFGCSSADALGKHINQFIPERFRPTHGDHIRRFGEVGTTNRTMGSLGSISGLRSNGEEFPIEASISQVEVGSERLFTVILRDVTERTASENALLESRRRMEGIVQSAMDAIITVDEEQRIVLFNPAAERMFGCSSEEALGATITRFIPERFRPGHDEHIRRFHQTGVTSRSMGALGAISGLRASGEEFPIEASISQVTVGGERLSTVILRDITERKTNEETRGLLAREVDHRAKNALAVAQSIVGLTKATSIEGFAEAVRGRIAALARAHSLLSHSQWRGAPLEELVRDELAPYAKDHQLDITGPGVVCSAEIVQSLSLIFHELATNAVKYGALSRDKGRVTISWRPASEKFIIEWDEAGGPVVRSPERSGFGTRLLEQVAARQLKADIKSDWREQGLRFTLELPKESFFLAHSATFDPRSATAPGSQVSMQPLPHAKVLLVEDEVLIAAELSEELTRLGWHIIGPAATLEEAQALLSEQFDAAVLDVNLGGHAVYPVADILLRQQVPFVFCTGYDMVDQEGRFANAPILHKPASAQAVNAALKELLASRPQ